jgi:outer membrane immunogenic protein
MKKLFIGSILAIATVGTASAADIAVKAPIPAPPPVSDWSGIYVGVEGGYGWGKQSTDAISRGGPFAATMTVAGDTLPLAPPFFFPDVAIPSIKQKGWLAGGFFGAQKQWANWVLGIEGDIDAADINGFRTSNASLSSPEAIRFSDGTNGVNVICSPATPCFTLGQNLSISSKVDALASLRGKVGWSFSPNWLIYGTGGAALAHVENTVVSTNSATVPPTGILGQLCAGGFTCTLPPGGSLNTSGGSILFGYAVGGGIDWKLPLDAGSALVFGVEYLHYGFPQQTITLTDNAGGSRSFRASQNVDAVKGRISYLFSIR